MYCPICRVEYREGFIHCSDCNVKLVNEIPPECAQEAENLVTVFEGDSSSASVARATVEGAGIESWIKDEEVHGLFPGLGSTEILVCEEDEQSALKALEASEHCASVPHGIGHSTSRQFRGAPYADNRRGKQNERSEKGHQFKERHRQGKRI